MSTSLFEGLVRSQESQWGSYAPADTAWSRSILQNVMHSADSCGQVLVNWRVNDANAIVRNLPEGTTWFAVAHFGPLPTRLRGDGSSYRYRVRMRGACDNGTIDLAVCAIGGRLTTSAGYDALAVGAPLTSAAEANTTDAWLSLSVPTINLASGSAATTEFERSTRAEIGGASVVAYWDAVRFVVFAKAKTGTLPNVARLSGLHLAEYIGND